MSHWESQFDGKRTSFKGVHPVPFANTDKRFSMDKHTVVNDSKEVCLTYHLCIIFFTEIPDSHDWEEG